MRVAVVSDIHGNLAALRSVLADAGPVEAVWCLGDTVGYGPEPDACVRTIRERPHAAVPGNHDWAAIGKADIGAFNPMAAEAARWTVTQLSAEVKEYLRLLPQRRVEGDFTLVHGSPRDPLWEYVLDLETAQASFDHFSSRYCLVGHTHVPSYFVQRGGKVEGHYVPAFVQPAGSAERLPEDVVLELEPDARYILNPGSVGQPRDDCPLSSYLLLDLAAGRVTWRRVAYDIAATQALMARQKLPKRLIERLAAGW